MKYNKPKPQETKVYCLVCSKPLKDYELALGDGDHCLRHQRELLNKSNGQKNNRNNELHK